MIQLKIKLSMLKMLNKFLTVKKVTRKKASFIKLTYTIKRKTDKVKEIKQVQLSKPIVYEAGATSDKKLAKEWMKFLKSDKAKKF